MGKEIKELLDYLFGWFMVMAGALVIIFLCKSCAIEERTAQWEYKIEMVKEKNYFGGGKEQKVGTILIDPRYEIADWSIDYEAGTIVIRLKEAEDAGNTE